LLLKAGNIRENSHASKEAARLAQFSGLIGRDIDVFKLFTASRDLLIIARMPDPYANAYVEELVNEVMKPKPGDVKGKVGPAATLKIGGKTYVSDIDLMCAHKFDRGHQRYIPLVFDWDGKRKMTVEEDDCFSALNRMLISKLQHGCNDNFLKDGRPASTDIGTDFISINRGRVQIILGVKNLRAHYDLLGLENWHAEYGCP
jgi:hypothetical protein